MRPQGGGPGRGGQRGPGGGCLCNHNLGGRGGRSKWRRRLSGPWGRGLGPGWGYTTRPRAPQPGPREGRALAGRRRVEVGRPAGAGGFYMSGGTRGRDWEGWANGNEGGARRDRSEWAGPGHKVWAGPAGAPGTGWGSSPLGIPARVSDGSHLCLVTLEPARTQVCTTCEASVFYPVKWGESVPSPLFCISGTPNSFQEFL